MEKIKVEYIILVDTKNSFCNSINAFNNLLSVSDEIKIEKNKTIKYKDLDIFYEVQTAELNEKEQRFFHLKFVCKQADKIDTYSTFLRIIRDILLRLTNKQPVSLWDDVSFYYANKSYPLIHEIENLMRKLLTKFAITKFESNWTDKNIPEEIKYTVKKKDKTSNDANYLYQTDFKDLTIFLSGKIKAPDFNHLLEYINNASNITDLDLENLKSYIPINNWDKHFSKVVDFEWKFFENRWDKLYELRCKVAHNNFLNKQDYEDICRLVNELKPKLEKAIEEMDKVNISTEDQESLAESFAINTNAIYGEFINLWKSFTNELFNLILKNQGDDPIINLEKFRYTPERIVKILVDKGILTRDFLIVTQNLKVVRNIMVHEIEIAVPENDIISKIEILKNCIAQIRVKSMES